MRILALDAKIVLEESNLARLKNSFEVRELDIASADESLVHSCDVLMLHSFLPDEVLRGMRRCSHIFVRAHNLDYVNAAVAREMGIMVAGIPQVSQQSVAEHTFALIFALAKRLLPSHENVMAGNWRSGLGMNMELAGKRLGVIGNGEIGGGVAQIGRALGMDVVCASRPGKSGGVALEELLATSDVVTLHIPAREENRNFMDERKISMMRKGAFLINTARGAVLDYAAAKKALDSGRLGGLGLDVFDSEPPAEYPFSRMQNVVCTPHQAYNTVQTLRRMNDAVVDAVLSALPQ